MFCDWSLNDRVRGVLSAPSSAPEAGLGHQETPCALLGSGVRAGLETRGRPPIPKGWAWLFPQWSVAVEVGPRLPDQACDQMS